MAHEMGLGKTCVSLRLIAQLGGDALVIVPKSMIGQWLVQADLWTPDLEMSLHGGGSVVVTNYERVLARPHEYDRHWGVIILDEAQRIKNWQTKTARLCKSLKADRHYALTGTPIENDINDLYSILEFIGVDVIHEALGVCGRAVINPKTAVAKYVSRALARKKYNSHFYDKVIGCIGNYMIRRRLDDMIEMPSIMVKRVEVCLNEEERQIYTDISRQLMVYVDGREFNITNALTRLTYLREVCNGIPTLLDDGGTSSKIEEVVGCAAEIAKSGNRSIIFTEFLRMASRLVSRLREMGYVVAELSGRIKDYDEEKAKDWDIIVCTKAGEVGHDLQRASYVLNVDLPYNPARVLQRVGRARRVGQDRGVVVVNFVVPGTVEDRILEILYEKRRVFYDVVDTGISMDRDLIRNIVQGLAKS
jgi:SNF2 family DNA or RNA helicase